MFFFHLFSFVLPNEKFHRCGLIKILKYNLFLSDTVFLTFRKKTKVKKKILHHYEMAGHRWWCVVVLCSRIKAKFCWKNSFTSIWVERNFLHAFRQQKPPSVQATLTITVLQQTNEQKENLIRNSTALTINININTSLA